MLRRGVDHGPRRSRAAGSAAEIVVYGRCVRGGEIILNSPLGRAVFIAGLAGAVVLALILVLIR